MRILITDANPLLLRPHVAADGIFTMRKGFSVGHGKGPFSQNTNNNNKKIPFLKIFFKLLFITHSAFLGT